MGTDHSRCPFVPLQESQIDRSPARDAFGVNRQELLRRTDGLTRFCVASLRCNMKRRLSLLVQRIRQPRATATDQDRADIGVAQLSSHVKQRPAIRPSLVQASSVLESKSVLADLRVAALNGKVQCSPTRGQIRELPRRDQRLNNLQITIRSGEMEWVEAVNFQKVRVGPGFEEQLAIRNIIAFSSEVQSCHPLRVLIVNEITCVGQKNFAHCGVATRRSDVQSGLPTHRFRTHGRKLGLHEQFLDHIGMALSSSNMQSRKATNIGLVLHVKGIEKTQGPTDRGGPLTSRRVEGRLLVSVLQICTLKILTSHDCMHDLFAPPLSRTMQECLPKPVRFIDASRIDPRDHGCANASRANIHGDTQGAEAKIVAIIDAAEVIPRKNGVTHGRVPVLSGKMQHCKPFLRLLVDCHEVPSRQDCCASVCVPALQSNLQSIAAVRIFHIRVERRPSGQTLLWRRERRCRIHGAPVWIVQRNGI